ncbi:MAG TPA: thiamine pyrophosphate-dependent enzyme, partial [Acidimicrobiales bacterium]|nr:thiamine pyrophosphate-dependent enzyme [Acidimicrobiales bacterium]
GCEVHELAGPETDPAFALEDLAEAVGARPDAALRQEPMRPEPPMGALNAQSAAIAIGALLPEDAIVSDESNTAGIFLSTATAGAPRHDWLCLTGGAIGQGLPLAVGAAVAEPDRKVLCLEADGSAMYTFQSLWTCAREGLDVTTVIFDNGSYAVLEMELDRVGAGTTGPRARAMLELDNPNLDFVSLSKGLGVPATRATTADELVHQLRSALAVPGPALVVASVGRL